MSRALVAAFLLVPTIAAADAPRDTPAAIELDREAPPPGRSELGFDAGAPVEGWAAALSLGYLYRPITLRSGGAESRPVERREKLALGGAVGLGETVVLDARMPFVHQIGARLAILGDDRALDRWAPGDLRIGGRIRVVRTTYADALVRGEVSLPTGDDQDFAGEASWGLAWSLIGRFRLPAGIVLAATGGIRLRGAEVMIGDRIVGDELHGGVGIAVPVPPIHPLWCVADQVKLTGELVGSVGDEVRLASGPSPAEARIGIVTRPLESVTIGIRIGAGLGDEIGAPRWRATFEITYHGSQRLIRPAAPADPTEQDDHGDSFDP
ncbi:hypothetical protein BH11MYX3_BH11MYX3_45480 [soil metagenome]